MSAVPENFYLLNLKSDNSLEWISSQKRLHYDRRFYAIFRRFLNYSLEASLIPIVIIWDVFSILTMDLMRLKKSVTTCDFVESAALKKGDLSQEFQLIYNEVDRFLE